MVKRILIILLQIILISAALLLAYYFFYLKPKIQLSKNRIEAVKVLAIHKNTLTQNRIAYIALSQLDPKSPTFASDTLNLISTLETTQKEGLNQLNAKNILPNTNILKEDDFSNLLKTNEDIYKTQEGLLAKIKSTTSYSDGLKIIKSQESITLLTNQTNLILKYQYWLERLK